MTSSFVLVYHNFQLILLLKSIPVLSPVNLFFFFFFFFLSVTEANTRKFLLRCKMPVNADYNLMDFSTSLNVGVLLIILFDTEDVVWLDATRIFHRLSLVLLS